MGVSSANAREPETLRLYPAMYFTGPRERQAAVETLDEDLKGADPATRIPRGEAAVIIEAMASALSWESDRPRRWWSNWRITVPVGIVGALALTGAAAVMPLVLGVDGQEVELDARIPIRYVTDSGVTVECVYGIYLGSPAGRTVEVERAADFLADYDWEGIGEEIYDWAMTHPVTPGENEVWEVDTPELRDQLSFRLAVSPVVLEKLPPDLRDAGIGFSSTDTCSGQLR